MAQATCSRTAWQSASTSSGRIGRQGGPAVAEGPPAGRIGPSRLAGRGQRGCSEAGVRVVRIVADVLAREDPLDGLLDGPDGCDHPLVEDARPGVGEQDLRLERQPVQRVGQRGGRARRRRGSSSSSWLQGADQLGDLGGGTGSPRRRQGETPRRPRPCRRVARGPPCAVRSLIRRASVSRRRRVGACEPARRGISGGSGLRRSLVDALGRLVSTGRIDERRIVDRAIGVDRSTGWPRRNGRRAELRRSSPTGVLRLLPRTAPAIRRDNPDPRRSPSSPPAARAGPRHSATCCWTCSASMACVSEPGAIILHGRDARLLGERFGQVEDPAGR